MKPLDQWNCEQQSSWDDRLKAFAQPELFPNGLICPSCCGSLYDTGQTFKGPPIKLRVKCMTPGCTFRGERLDHVPRFRCDEV